MFPDYMARMEDWCGQQEIGRVIELYACFKRDLFLNVRDWLIPPLASIACTEACSLEGMAGWGPSKMGIWPR